jgi:hypothetical protein
MATRKTVKEILNLYTRRNKDACWEWTGYKSKVGYGSLTNKGKVQRAHRFIYEQLVGAIPDGMVLDHLCTNKACVNPDHLEPVTILENTQRFNKTRTHCKNGHEFTLANTYTPPKRLDRRYCRTCQYQRVADYKLRLQGGY